VTTTDDDLLWRSRVRPELLGELYERHAAAIFRFLVRRVGTGAAEDLLGEVFVVAVEARLRFRPHASGSALPWLYGIATNLLRSHLRRSKASTGVTGADKETGAVADVDAVDWDAVDARLDAGSRRGELRRALSALTPDERELLLLVAWEGLSPAEAGEALGITSVAARSRLHRARSRAQAALELPLIPCSGPRRI
jgi:RNA polymerase sigma-70 factor (ECF subfamily)